MKGLIEYIKELESKLEKAGKKVDWEVVLAKNLKMIGFFQHERLIHLLVTLFFALIFWLTTIFVLLYPIIFVAIVDLLLLVLTLGYIIHYFRLENNVQKLYKLDKKIVDLL